MLTITAPTSKNNGSVQKSQTVYSVLRTGNYEQFKLMPDNRNLNLLHVKRLVESFNERYLVCPIIVNEKLEVIDGQHRLQACKETLKPVYYIVIKGYAIKEVQILNTNQKNWNKMDFLNMYCAEGKKVYLDFKKFMDDFPDFKIQATERILSERSSRGRTGEIGGIKATMKDFEEGKLIIPNLQRSYLNAKKIMEFKPFFSEFNSGLFVSAILPLFISKTYQHKEMLHKLTVCPIKLYPCRDIEQYRLLLEDIYNHKRQKENKVSFRYS